MHQSQRLLLELIETTQTPVFQSLKGFGSLPVDHTLQAGPATNLAMLASEGRPQPDLLILLGARTGMFLAGRSGAVIPNNNCNIIQVDIDGGEIGISHPVAVGIVSDVSQALEALNGEVKKQPFKASEEWLQTVMSLKTATLPDKTLEKTISGRLHPQLALQEAFSALEPGSIICIDGGECGSWASGLLEHARPNMAFFAAGYLGMLGNGYGYALGAAIADPSRQVVNIQGDGSAGFHIAELDTFFRFGLNILTIVVNNYVWGMSTHGQELIYGEKSPARPVSSLSPVTQYHTVAHGFANGAAKVDKFDAIKETVKTLSTQDGPACLELLVSDRPIHPGVISIVSATDDPKVIVVPYYDNLPRPFFHRD
jgi:thiamine pyrophosphate-dependent acetolactate synthase large subunit-like protein